MGFSPANDVPLTSYHFNFFQSAKGIKSEIVFINGSQTLDIILSSIYVLKLGNEMSCMDCLCMLTFYEVIHFKEQRERE